MLSTSLIELSQKKLHSNINYIKKIIGKKVILSSVIKGNAYGHGIEQFVEVAQQCGINHFSVYSADEAYRALTVSNSKTTIMIMGWLDNDDIRWAIENEIEFYVFDFDRLEHTINVAKKLHKKAIVHIEIETGMNRTGFLPKSIDKLINILRDNTHYITFQGLCTHYAGAESIANYLRIIEQYEEYQRIYNIFNENQLLPKIRHTASSAATISYPQARMDMVRVGILTYGYWPSPETFIEFVAKAGLKRDPLQSIITWKSKVMNIKFVKTGDFIGYGMHFQADRNMKIAVVPVGYSHGYSRSLSNQGKVLINDKITQVIGIVNMNLIILNVTLHKEIKIGDEVVLIGKQGKKKISVHSFTEMSDQINYEMLTRLPINIPRIITE